MKERPILFQGAMVRAILDGSKTQTRRVVKPVGKDDAFALVDYGDGWWPYRSDDGESSIRADGNETPISCPYGHVGDRLWVRESHWWFKDEPDHETGYYPPVLTVEDVEFRADGDDGRKVWRPSIHMPRWASRITLEITDVRVERLNSISEADARAEGAPGYEEGIDAPPPDEDCEWSYYSSYWRLWESINGPGSWEANPWVWCVSFRRIES